MTITASVENGIGRVLLDRPQALNALTLDMVEASTDVLNRWRSDTLRAVLFESSSPKAFCAGGDIRAVRHNTLDGHPERSEAFFAAEYAMNAILASYPHPLIAIIDGVCMGGGLGLSVHGPYRVVTERAVMAMPETAIGFFPDIGASYFLPRLPGAMGMFLGLTGARANGADAVRSGLATHLVPSDQVGALTERLCGGGDVAATLDAFAVEPNVGPLTQAQAEIDGAFSADSVAEIRARLIESGSAWANKQRSVLDQMSPSSLEITFDLITQGRDRSLHECLHAELEMTRTVTASPDFIEGVRAVLVDKDHNPRWQ